MKLFLLLVKEKDIEKKVFLFRKKKGV